MAFWVYGRDGETGQQTEPFFSDAGTEEGARAEASEQGIIAERVERHTESAVSGGTRTIPPPGVGSFARFCLTVGQIISVLACCGAILGTVMGTFISAAQYGVLGVIANLLIGFGSFCYSAAMTIVFAQAKESRRA